MSDEPLPNSEIILYQTEDGRTRIQCRFENETLWLTQAQIAELFQTTPQNVTLHLKGIFAEGELDETATCKDYLQVRLEGGREVLRKLRHYRLEAILAVGFRVRSHRGTQFRQWATARLSEYLVKGFTMDDERLKNPPGKGQQNKMHWATHGQTAAEVIAERADAGKPFMGLQTTRPGGIVRKDDVGIAKNYLTEDELQVLNRIVNLYIEYAELQALERKPMTMRDWITKLDEFLKISGRKLLDHAGKISAESAKTKAELEYARYRKLLDAQPQRIDAVFEKAAKELKKLPRPKQPKPPKP